MVNSTGKKEESIFAPLKSCKGAAPETVTVVTLSATRPSLYLRLMLYFRIDPRAMSARQIKAEPDW